MKRLDLDADRLTDDDRRAIAARLLELARHAHRISYPRHLALPQMRSGGAWAIGCNYHDLRDTEWAWIAAQARTAYDHTGAYARHVARVADRARPVTFHPSRDGFGTVTADVEHATGGWPILAPSISLDRARARWPRLTIAPAPLPVTVDA